MKFIAKTITFLLLAGMPAMAEFDAELLQGELSELTKVFLSADTATARSSMTKFSDEELQKITTAFKKSHSKEEQRLFWLSEELYRRNAERVATERIRYLYFAVIAALALITLFSLLTYREAKRQRVTSIPSDNADIAAGITQAASGKVQTQSRATKKKTGRKAGK